MWNSVERSGGAWDPSLPNEKTYGRSVALRRGYTQRKWCAHLLFRSKCTDYYDFQHIWITSDDAFLYLNFFWLIWIISAIITRHFIYFWITSDISEFFLHNFFAVFPHLTFIWIFYAKIIREYYTSELYLNYLNKIWQIILHTVLLGYLL